MSQLSSQLDNISEHFSQPPRKVIVARGPTLAFSGSDDIPDDYEADDTLVWLDRPAIDEPDEDSFAEEIPFSEALEDDD